MICTGQLNWKLYRPHRSLLLWRSSSWGVGWTWSVSVALWRKQQTVLGVKRLSFWEVLRKQQRDLYLLQKCRGEVQIWDSNQLHSLTLAAWITWVVFYSPDWYKKTVQFAKVRFNSGSINVLALGNISSVQTTLLTPPGAIILSSKTTHRPNRAHCWKKGKGCSNRTLTLSFSLQQFNHFYKTFSWREELQSKQRKPQTRRETDSFPHNTCHSNCPHQ